LRGAGLGRGSRPFVAERELRYEVMNIASKAGAASPQRCAELSRQLGELVGSADQTWLASGATCAAIARAYGELGQFDDAVKFYERVLVAEPATASLQSVEQLANLLARLADKRATPDLSFMERSAELLQHLPDPRWA